MAKSSICEVYNEGFSYQCKLDKQKYIHDAEKPFVCEMCNKGFS